MSLDALDAIFAEKNSDVDKVKLNALGISGVNPDAEAARVQLSRQSGVPTELINAEVTQSIKRDQFMRSLEGLPERSPATSEFLSDQKNMNIAHDDVHNLTKIEENVSLLGKLWKTVKPVPALAYSEFQRQVGSGYSWVGNTVLQPLIDVVATDDMKKKYGTSNFLTILGNQMQEESRSVTKYIESAEKLDSNILQGVRGGLTSTYSQLPLMVAGGFASTVQQATQISLGGMGVLSAAGAYGETKEKGNSDFQAGMAAVGNATVEVGTEMFPITKTFEMLKPGAKVGLKWVGTKAAQIYGGEIVGESIATFLQDIIGKAYDRPDMKPQEVMDKVSDYITSGEAKENFVNTLISTLTQTTVMAGGAAGINRASQAIANRSEAKSKAEMDAVLNVITSAEASALSKRDPESFADFTQSVGEKHGISKVYLQSDRLLEEIQSQGWTNDQISDFAAQYGIDQADLAVNIPAGGAIEMDFGKVVSGLAQKDERLSLFQKDIAIRPEVADQQADEAHMTRITELYQQDQDNRINRDDLDFWKKSLLETPKLKGRVTEESLDLIAARANALQSITGIPAIEHANRMLASGGLRAIKFKDFQPGDTANDIEDIEISQNDVLSYIEYIADGYDYGNHVINGNRTNSSYSNKTKLFPFLDDPTFIGKTPKDVIHAIKQSLAGKKLGKVQEILVTKSTEWAIDQMRSTENTYISNGTLYDSSGKELFQFSSPQSRQGSETLSLRKTQEQGMLAPAVLKNGEIRAAGIGATHYDVHSVVKAEMPEGVEEANGFVTPDGQFLSRSQANEWLKANRPDIYKALDSTTKKNGLESQAYAHAEGMGGDSASLADAFIKKQFGGGGLMFFQEGKDPLGALTFEDGKNIVSLFEKADKSTFLHEAAHIFLNDLKYVAENMGAQTAEWEAVKEWLGSEDGNLTTEQHERFAEHFEVYLREGVAPTPTLKSAFRKFKTWLTKIYDAIQSKRFGQRQGITVSPEIKEIFDKLLATDEDIQAAREHAALVAMLDNKLLTETGFSQEQIDSYRRITEESADRAKEKIDTYKMAGLSDRLEGFREQAVRESRDIPVYAFLEVLANDSIQINKESLKQFLTDEQYSKLPNISKLWEKTGLGIVDAVAEHGGLYYESPAKFANDLATTEPIRKYLDKRVAQLEVEYEMQGDTDEAIRNASMLKMLEMESKWLADQLNRDKEKELNSLARKDTAIPAAVIRQWAKGVVESRGVSQFGKIQKMIADARKHRQQAIKLARKGEWEGALKSNEQARLSEELLYQTYKAKAEWEKIQRAWKKISKWANDNKNVKVTEDYRNLINRLLSQYEIAEKEYDPKTPELHEFIGKLAGADEFGLTATLPDWIGVDPKPVKQLTWEEAKELNDALQFLYGKGKESLGEIKTSRDENVADLRDQMVADMFTISGDKRKLLAGESNRLGLLIRKVQGKYRSYFANTAILRFIAIRLDGYKNVKGGSMGVAETTVQRVIDGQAQHNNRYEEIYKRIEPYLKTLITDRFKQYDIPPSPLLQDHSLSWTRERVIVAALNMGNASNWQRLVDGYSLTEEHIRAIQSSLTTEEWQAIQGIWDTINSLWPDLAAVHKRINYFTPKKIEAQPIEVTTADGETITLAGGYYPAHYDSSLDSEVAKWGEADNLLASNEAIMQVPAAKSGMSKSRQTKVTRPIKLSLSVLSTHISDTLKYITMAEVIRDADRVLGHGKAGDEFIAEAHRVIGKEMYDMIRPALKHTIRPEPNTSGMLESFRVKMSAFYMSFNLWTALQNVTGVFPAIRQVGMGNYLAGMKSLTNPLDKHKAMLEMSSYMKLREANIERDMKKQVRDFSMNGIEIAGRRITGDDAIAVGWAGIRFIDTVVALPAWWGKYDAEMAKHGDMEKAVHAADSAVNKALGSGLGIDATGFQRNKILSLFVPFMSFAATQQEVMRTEYEAMRQGKISKADFLYGRLMTLVLPSVFSTFLQGALMYGIVAAFGGGDDDKKKTAKDYLTDLAAYRAMGLPFARDFINAAIGGLEGGIPITSARMPIAEPIKMAQQLFYNVGGAFFADDEEKAIKKIALSSAELASLYTGIPASRLYRKWVQGQKQIDSGEGWMMNRLLPQERKK